jgi:hyperosmotically inducible periplasmic protein
MKTMNKIALMITGSLLAGATLMPAAANTSSPKPLGEKVRHELVTLPYFNVFDSLSYEVIGNEVTLYGKVTRPTLRSSAENVVKAIPGVGTVHNAIEVLPLSPFDDRLRLALYRSIYSQPALNRYAMGAIPGIHIIVKNGNVTLEGVVANEMDRNIAFLGANGVSGVFSVENHLHIDGQEK